MLRNRRIDLDGPELIGLDDWWADQFAPAGLLERGGATVALSHNPDTVDLPVWDDFRGWILAGHTHGGQCKPPFLPPPFLPPPLLPVQNRRYTAGEFALGPERRLYISRGVGHLLGVRINARPEVTLFELTPA